MKCDGCGLSPGPSEQWVTGALPDGRVLSFCAGCGDTRWFSASYRAPVERGAAAAGEDAPAVQVGPDFSRVAIETTVGGAGDECPRNCPCHFPFEETRMRCCWCDCEKTQADDAPEPGK